MSIRAAKFADIMRMVEILEEAHKGSVYAKRCGVCRKSAKDLLSSAIQRNGHTTAGGTLVAVAETDGRIEGFILAALDQVYHIGDKLSATDLFWICTDQVHPKDPWKLYRAMERWARKNPNVIEIVSGATDVVAPHTRTETLLLRNGYRRFGGIYRKEIAR